jgi:flagellar biosynthesis protein FlhF
MKIRKYVARNMPEALQQVRDDLGASAVILSSRQIRRNNRFNPDDEARVEVTAAFDEAVAQGDAGAAPAGVRIPPVEPGGSGGRSETPSVAVQRYASQTGQRDRGQPQPKLRTQFEADPDPESEQVEPPPTVASSPPVLREATESSRRDADGVDVGKLFEELGKLQRAVSRMERQGRSGVVLPEALGRLAERMENVGLERTLIDALVQQLFEEMGGKALGDRVKVGERAASLLIKRMPKCRDIKVGRRRKVIGFFGAAGAGKSTAAAKIAAGFAMKGDYRIVLVSADDRRVGALDQARAFAQAIGVSLEVAYEEEEIGSILERHAQAQLVLVDPAGCGPLDQRGRERQRRLFEVAGADEVQVVIDAKSSLDHMLDQIEASETFAQRRLLFTKMDEVGRAGGVLSAAAASQIATSYFTVGPGVPGEIEAGNLSRLVSKMMGVSIASGKKGH